MGARKGDSMFDFEQWTAGYESPEFELVVDIVDTIIVGNFIGKEALARQKETGLMKRLVMFSIDDPQPLVYHDEPIFRNGELISENTHGAYSHSLGCSIGMCYLKNSQTIQDQWIMSLFMTLFLNSGTFRRGVRQMRELETVRNSRPKDCMIIFNNRIKEISSIQVKEDCI